MKPSTIQRSILSTALACVALGTALNVRADYSSTVQSFNPAAYWRLNETAAVPIPDLALNSGSLGAPGDGYYIGTPGSTYTHPITPGALAGSTDGAVLFSGNPPGGVAPLSYMAVPYSPSLNPNQFTAEAWLAPTDIDGTLGSPTHCAFSCGDFAAPRAGWLIYQSGEGWNLRMYNRNGTALSLSISGGGPPTPGAWYHVAVVFNGTTARLYINGVQVASGNPAPGPMPTAYVPGSAGPLRVGSRSDNAFPWNGTADELAFYSSPLSADVIYAHYRAATTNGTGYAAQILADNPVAYYRLNEPAWSAPDPSTLPLAANSGTLGADAQGTYNPDTYTAAAGPPYGGLGGGNSACRFGGNGGFIDCGATSGLDLTPGPFSIMAWMKVNQFNRTWQAVVTKGDSAWRLARNGDTDNLDFAITGLTPLDVAGTRKINDGQWHHATGVYDGSTMKLYVDGVLDASATATGTPSVNTYNVMIGENAQATGRFFSGTIDEVAIFTNALSAAQVQQIFHAANVPPIIVQQPQVPPGTVLAGAPVTLIPVVAAGTPTLTYQWTREGTNMPGQTTTTLAWSNITTNDAGNYAVVVNNPYGSTTSSVVALSVTYPINPAALATASGYPAYNPVTRVATLTEVTLGFTGPLAAEGSNPTHYSIPGLTVSGARFTNLNMTVVLTTSPQTEGANYTVTVTGVTDGVGRALSTNTAPFRAWVGSPLNGIHFEYYTAEAIGAIGNAVVGALTGNSLYPDYPALVTNLWAFDSRVIFPDDSHENYGARMRGVFVPSLSGNWRFFLRSDDASQVFLNPNGPDAAGKQLIVEETGCCGDWNKYQSAAIPLVAGQPYYIEMLFKEGGGGDYAKVAARLDGTGYPPTGTGNNVVDPASLVGPAIGSPYAPADAGGALTLIGPDSVTVQANHPATFTAAAANPGGWPMAYQWRRNGAPISGATGTSYTLVPTGPTTDRFTVQVSKLGSVAVSAEATLTVNADTDVPSVAAVHGSKMMNTAIVSFNELMGTPDAGSYTVAGFSTLSAVLDATGRNVILTFDKPLAPGQTYSLSIQNVKDATGTTLASAAVPLQSFVFSRGLLKFEYWGGLPAGAPNDIDSTLLADARFPDSPTWTGFLTAFDSRTIFPDDSHAGFGALVSGLFVPPTPTNYVFYLRSDDSSRLFMNVTGTDPISDFTSVSPNFLVEEPACCEGFAAHESPAQPLLGGQMYAVAAIYKEGGGGDYVQVATKADLDTTDPGALQPIPGSMLGILEDPIGASLTITRQPPNAVGVYLGKHLNGDFAVDNGGFAVVNYGNPVGPWSYNRTAGSWTNHGTADCGGPYATGLRSPVLTIRNTTPVVLTFKHRWSFEPDPSVNYDGGQVRLSVNGGPFATVPGASFTANGYGGPIGGTVIGALSGTPGWVNEAFVQSSPGYTNATRTLVTSVATLGTFTPGDTLQMEFVASWDECSEGTEPNWEVASAQVAGGDTVLATDVLLTIAATSTYRNLPNPYMAYFWQKDTGTGFKDIPGASTSAYLFYAGLVDSGTRFRCIVYSPGASATSDVATVTVTVPLYFARTAPDTLRLSWPLPPPPLTSTSFLLERSGTMQSGSWVQVPTSEYKTTADLVYVDASLSTTGQTQFYRLRRP